MRLKVNDLVDEKDTKSREYNEQIKRLNGQIDRLAKEIDAEQELRDPTDEEAPWQGLVDQAQDKAGQIRRGRVKRDRTGELPEDDKE